MSTPSPMYQRTNCTAILHNHILLCNKDISKQITYFKHQHETGTKCKMSKTLELELKWQT